MLDAMGVEASRLTATLEAYPEVLLAYLFGSRATGTARAGSDVDVAVLTDQPLTTARHLTLLADLTDAARGHRVDLVLLDQAPPALGYRVVRDGVPLLVRDEVVRADHHAQVLDRYFDTEPLRREMDRRLMLLQGLRDGGRAPFLADVSVQAQVERHLQPALQAAIDVALHLAADAPGRPVEGYGDAFAAPGERGALPDGLASSLRAAAGMRNVLVHG